MKLVYNNKEIDLKICNSFFNRLMGFMFKKDINYALMFNKCNSIHTCFMRENIDVIMCDKNNKVLFYYRNLGKNKVILPKKGVRKVFETPGNYFDVVIGKKMIIDED